VETGRQGSPPPVDPPTADRRVRPWLLAGVAVAVIAGSMAWWARATHTGEIGDVRLLDRPLGTPIVLSLYPVTALPDAEHFVVGRRSLRFVVRGDPAGLRVGDDVTVEGVVGEGEIVAERTEVAAQRPAKRRLGVVGLLVTAIAVVAGRPVRGEGRVTWPIS
jgi:hypothetical protein